MNSRQRKRREFLLRTGFIKPANVSPNSTYKRTEGNNCYYYSNSIANIWESWSRNERDAGTQPLFKNFYEQLSSAQQLTVTVIPVQINING